MKNLKFIAIAFAFLAFAACDNEESANDVDETNTTTEQPTNQVEPTPEAEEDKTEIKLDGESGEIGFENKDVDVDVDVDGDDN